MMLYFTQGYPIEFPKAPAAAQLVIAGPEKHVSEGGPSFAGAETALFQPGVYRYQLLAEDGVFEEGTLQLKVNLALSPDGADVMPARRILEAIEAQIAGKATAAQASISVGDKSISYYSLSDLLRLR